MLKVDSTPQLNNEQQQQNLNNNNNENTPTNLEQNEFLNSFNKNQINSQPNGFCMPDNVTADETNEKVDDSKLELANNLNDNLVDQVSSPPITITTTNQQPDLQQPNTEQFSAHQQSNLEQSGKPSNTPPKVQSSIPKSHLQRFTLHQSNSQPNFQPHLQYQIKELNFQDDDSVFLPDSSNKLRSVNNNQSDCYLNKKFVNKKLKKKLPKNKKQIITCLNNNPHLLQANCLSLNNLNTLSPSHHLNNQFNSLNTGQFILTEHSFTVMEESTDEEKQPDQQTLYNGLNNNDLNHITINAQENKYQYLHQNFHHHSNDLQQKALKEEALISSPTIVQPTNTHSLIALQQRKQLQQQQLQQRKEQNAKHIRHRSNIDALNGLIFVLSAIYAKLIVIMGLCFPMAEVISHRIPIIYYEGFYLYLYLGSIFYLAIIYMSRESSKHKINTFSKIKRFFFWSNVEKNNKPNSLMHENSFTSNYTLAVSGNISINSSCSENDSLDQNKKAHFGSFYLRLGAVAFGIGSMIYSGLEFGQFFELENKEQCYSFLLMILPTCHMIFTFLQLYFLFMNSKSLIVKHRYLSRFGLMHMISTNICVWLHVLIQETKHQIMMLLYPNKSHDANVKVDGSLNSLLHPLPTIASSFLTPFQSLSIESAAKNLNMSILNQNSTVHRIKRSIEDHEIFTHGICRRSNVIGQLVMDASQFLFPCTIEYSLISAAILYIMWKQTDTDIRSDSSHGRMSSSNENRMRHRSAASSSTVNYQHHQKHYYQVDCNKASKGLFCGIFLLVVCIISLILFFVLIKKPNYKNLGMLQAHVVEIILYIINAIACLIAILQIQELPYNRERNVELDNILLIVAQFGLYLFNGFSLIGAHFYHDATKNTSTDTQLIKISAVVCLIQATLQTVFILDATKRMAYNSDQVRRKPGREMVTFLLVCNFSMWAINTLESRRAESTPVQLAFYGGWAWTIFTHITGPLTIFFRFHSTVCLCDIWKRTYKLKTEY